MGMAAAAWDVLAKAANLAQMSGLHAAVLVAVLTTLLRVYHSNRRECARLERCTRRLRALLQWRTTGSEAALLLCAAASTAADEETGDPFGEALADAAGLVESYKESTLWRRVRNGGRLATQLRDTQEVVNSYCGLVLFANAHLLLQRHHHHPIPASSDTTVNHETNDTSQSPSAQAVTGTTQRANDIGQGGMDNDPAPAGCERNVPAELLPIIISRE